MSRYDGYSDEESDIDIRIEHDHRRASSSRRPPVHYVESRPARRYYDDNAYLVPAQERTLITTRSRSRERRSSAASAAPSAAPQAPVVINNRIYNHSDSDSDSGSESRLQLTHRRSHSRGGPSAYDRERYEIERARRDSERDAETRRRDRELERTQRELEELRLSQKIERDERRRDRSYEEERELKDAKKELEDIRRARAREDDEKRIKQKLELERLREEENAHEEKVRRDKEAKEAVERYKKDEAERKLRQKQEEEERDREYKHRMQEQLLKSGLDEKEINAILAGKKVAKDEKKDDSPRPTFTRMARKHLSIETLRVYNIDYELDTDPNYVLIKRWVTESEQDMLWRHTKIIREQRSGKLVMTIEDKKKHHHLEPEFEWVRKKERKRSRSPSLLMYLAGGKPA